MGRLRGRLLSVVLLLFIDCSSRLSLFGRRQFERLADRHTLRDGHADHPVDGLLQWQRTTVLIAERMAV